MQLYFNPASPYVRKVRVTAHELDLQGVLDIGTISIACALGYLDLRFASEGWRTSRPRLAAWAAAIAKRPSVAATAPPVS